MALGAKLSSRDEKFREKSLNDTMWKVILTIGTPLALYQGSARSSRSWIR